MRTFGKIVKWFFIITGTLLVVGVLTVILFCNFFYKYVDTDIMESAESLIELETMPVNLSSTVYYKDKSTGEYVEWVTLQNTENREWISWSNIPSEFVNAVVSIEDQRFWEHNGVDWKRTAAACVNMVVGEKVFGGSTITQQLIKNLTGENEVTVKRKVTEICRALRLEERYTKEEILEWYLNIIYFGNGQYGICAAADYYYGKPVSELSLAEICSIVAITNNPSKYNPYSYPQNNKDRQEVILDKMEELGYISPSRSQREKDVELTLRQHSYEEKSGAIVYPYYVDTVIEDVIQYFEDTVGVTREQATTMLYYGGYDIYTCVDMDIQKIMDNFYQDPSNIPETRDGKQLQSSMVVIDPYTGDIVGLEGGVGEKEVSRGLNWASSSLGRRPPGSSFKPIAVYAPAIDYSIVTPDSMFLDSDSVTLDGTDWFPKNDNGKNYGWVDVRYGVVRSLNTIAAQVMDEMTPATSYSFLTQKLHMTLEPADEDYAPLAVGQLSIGTTAREMASAYTIFPSGGTYRQGRTFSAIYNSEGTLVCDNQPVTEAAISDKTAYWITDILQDAVDHGTGTGAKLSNMPCAGKTGTTTDAKDRWFVGYTPYYVGAVWTGYSQPAKISVSGNPAAAIWKQVMTEIHANLSYKDFNVPADTTLPIPSYVSEYREYDEWEDEEEPVLPEDEAGYWGTWGSPYWEMPWNAAGDETQGDYTNGAWGNNSTGEEIVGDEWGTGTIPAWQGQGAFNQNMGVDYEDEILIENVPGANTSGENPSSQNADDALMENVPTENNPVEDAQTEETPAYTGGAEETPEEPPQDTYGQESHEQEAYEQETYEEQPSGSDMYGDEWEDVPEWIEETWE